MFDSRRYPLATRYSLITRDTVGSTQDEARAAFRIGGPPVLLIAGEQRQGRGRTGREWVHAPRAVAASLAMEVPWPLDRLGPLPLVAGLAARSAMAALGVTLGLDWPNDLVDTEGRKVGGLLVETAGDVLVAGCGINLFFPDAPPGIAGCFAADPGPAVPIRTAGLWADDLLGRIERGPGWDVDEYRSACVLLGAPVTWEPQGAGRAIDVAEDGALMVQTNAGVVELRSGEVTRVRGTTLAADTTTERGRGDGPQG